MLKVPSEEGSQVIPLSNANIKKYNSTFISKYLKMELVETICKLLFCLETIKKY